MTSPTTSGDHRVDVEEAGFERFISASDELFAAIASARGRLSVQAGLTPAQSRLLEPLRDGDRLPVSQLARRAGIAVPSATRALQGLEACGVVQRQRAEGNERVVEVRLTPKGRRALQDQRRQLRERQRRVYESIPAADRERVVDLARTLVELTWEVYGVAPSSTPENTNAGGSHAS